MHQAHQQLFKHLKNDGAIIVIETNYANLTPNKTRQKHTIYPLYYFKLDEIKSLSGKEFIGKLTMQFPNLTKIVVGFDFHFGYKASCDIFDLKKLFKHTVKIVDEYKLDDEAIHSKIIREYLITSQITKANKYLGYNYTIQGIHIKGQGLGSKAFVPTININVTRFLIPASGVYSSKTIVDDIVYDSVTFIGDRLTTDNNFAIETHIKDDNFSGRIIDDTIKIEFIDKIRANKKFDSFDRLKQQILKDIQT